MALDGEELNRRREAREARRKKQLAEQRKLQRNLIIAAAVLLICGVAIFVIAGGGSAAGDLPEEPETQATRATQAATEAPQSGRDPVTVVHIRAAGDLNVTDSVIAAGAGPMGYDFTECFMGVAHVLAGADLTMLNFEGNLCGGPYGTASTSAPQELAEALRSAGVDIVQMANSCTVNNGLIGLSSTLNSFRSAGIEPIGAYATPSEFKQTKGYTICEVQGIKIAVVAFTKGVGSMGLPAGNEDCVNLLYTDYATTYREIDTDGIKTILKAVASEKPDITIAMLHWGSEYNDAISASQESIVSLMQNQGVDIILGTHSHRVQRIDFDETQGTLVAYSLGDFFGDATAAGSNYSIILDVEITQDSDLGETKVTGYSFYPIYTLKESETCDNQRRVVMIDTTMHAYEKNFVDKVTADAYASMENSLERIKDRVSPKEEAKE